MKTTLGTMLLALAWSGSVAAQDTVAQPAETARGMSQEGEGGEDDGHITSYEATASVSGTLREEDRIGDYNQPRWTAHRRFPTTRIYVVPSGTVAFEYWWETKLDLGNLDVPGEADPVRHRSMYEFEFGLGNRLQLDLYLQTQQEGWTGAFTLFKEKLELRYALADWGVIPLNPTLYLEFVRENGAPPAIEFKILLGEELGSRLHLGVNLVVEHVLGDEQENEYALTTGISYTLADEVFSVGLELKFETVDSMGNRFGFDAWELLAGPSIAWAPSPPMHVLFVGLLGVEHEEGENVTLFEPTLIVGWEF